MNFKTPKTLIWLIALIPPYAIARQRTYSQITAIFTTERIFKHEYSIRDNSLSLEFEKTTPEELQSFENYDESLIKRVIFKEVAPIGTKIKIILRDHNVKAHIHSQNDPFRVIVEIYDKNYLPKKDRKTEFPDDHPITIDQSNQEDNLVNTPSKKSAILGASPQLLLRDDETIINEPIKNSSKTRRRLLQQLAQPFVTTEEMESVLKTVPDGIAPRWAQYPPYIYRLQMNTYEGRDYSGKKLKKERFPSFSEALSSSTALAEYAGKAFDLGNENKALILYHQLLQKDPEIFDKDATSLWKLSEIHLGNGNLTLARGYYESLLEKHPESAFTPFAQLRMLDIAAIRLTENGNYEEFSTLNSKLDAIKIVNRGELSALVALRRAYWTSFGIEVIKTPQVPPRVTQKNYQILAENYNSAESSKTAFLIGSILINEMTEPSSQWNGTQATFAESFFKRFFSSKSEQTITNLKGRLYKKINENIQTKINRGYLIEALEDYEKLPVSMRSIRKNPRTAWALAEAYRNLDQKLKAIEYYQEASSYLTPGSTDRFKAEFWTARLALGEAANQGTSGTKRQRLISVANQFDKKMSETWNKMDQKSKDVITTSYRDHFEKAVTDSLALRRPAQIVLSQWTGYLTSKASTSTGSSDPDLSSLSDPVSPSSSVFLITDLAKIFANLGMQKERKESILLLSKLKPSDFGDDQSAKNTWAKNLMELAEDYRKSNQYLDAGRLFGLVGDTSENFDKRAETLYKSGLLLFRAGRKQEAISAFQKAADDGNNLFYANLAKERLNQIQ